MRLILALSGILIGLWTCQAQMQSQTCNSEDMANYNGTVLVNYTSTSIGDCCYRCQALQGCQVYVYCPKSSGCDNGYGILVPANLCVLKTAIYSSSGALSVWSRGSATPFTSGTTTSANSSPATVTTPGNSSGGSGVSALPLQPQITTPPPSPSLVKTPPPASSPPPPLPVPQPAAQPPSLVRPPPPASGTPPPLPVPQPAAQPPSLIRPPPPASSTPPPLPVPQPAAQPPSLVRPPPPASSTPLPSPLPQPAAPPLFFSNNASSQQVPSPLASQPAGPLTGSSASVPIAAQSLQALSPEAQARAIAQLNATATAPAPVSTGLNNAQEQLNQPCTAASGTATQISGSGPATPIQNYPYLVSLRSDQALGGTTDNPTHFCGGTLIASTVIMTAAHCCSSDPEAGSSWAPNFTTSPGQSIRHPPVAVVGTPCSHQSGLQSQSITHVVIHPLWNKDSNNGYDICLMVTQAPFNFTGYLAKNKAGPIYPKLASSSVWGKDNLPLSSAGWGANSGGGPPSPVLRGLDMFLLPREVGNTTLAVQNDTLQQNQLIAFSQSGSTCQGDSGGPLLYSVSNHTDPSTDVVVGIVSYGPTECAAGSWTVFSDVVSFLTSTDKSCGDLDNFVVNGRADAFLSCALPSIIPGLDITSLFSNLTDFFQPPSSS